VRLVFADSSYYIALLLRNDEHHDVARRVGTVLDREYTRWLTPQAVIFEVLAFFSRGGPPLRARAAELVDRLRSSSAVEIVPTSGALFDGAISLYRSRLDQRYSLADCLAMVICRERGITEILSTDRDFEAEGFTILLKR
jgi:predicted nucleic acid-binding protein